MIKFKKFVAASTAVLFLTSTILTPITEANIWQERRANSSQPQYAALPAALNSPWSWPINKMAPSVRISNQIAKTKLKSTQRLNALAQTIPMSYGTLKKITPSKNGATDRLVVAIQDVHQNQEAQSNISNLVAELGNKHQLDLLGIEAAFGPLNLHPYQTYSDQGSIRRVAAYFLKTNRITGPIQAAMTNPTIANVTGIDDANHYERNVAAYRAAESLSARAQKQIGEQLRAISKDKAKIFSAELKKFDDNIQLYRDQKIALGAHVENILNISQKSTLQTDLFVEAWKLERKINFAQVEIERNQVLTQLAEKLSSDELTQLTQYSVAFRMGQLNHPDLFSYLKNLCEHKNITLSKFPEFHSYLQYVLLSDAIDGEKLFSDLQNLEQDAYSRLITTEAENKLAAQDRALHLASKLVQFSLTRDEWKEYSSLSSRNDLSSFEQFYVEAEARDRAMATNLAQQLSAGKTAVLVAGGFHSEGVSRLLAEKGITTLLVTPRITKVENENGSASLSAFAQEKSSLDKLLQGDKLFLGQPPLQVTPARAGLVVAADLEAGQATTGITATERNAIQSQFGTQPLQTSDTGEGQATATTSDGNGISYQATSSDADRKIVSLQVITPSFNVGQWFLGLARRVSDSVRGMINNTTANFKTNAVAAVALADPMARDHSITGLHWFVFGGLVVVFFIGSILNMTKPNLAGRQIPVVIWPEDFGSTEVSYTGGKGVNLNIMALNGDPGKLNTIISPTAYDNHINQVQVDYKGTKWNLKAAIYDLTDNLDSADPQARIDASRQIASWIEESEMNPVDAALIDQAYFDLSRREIAIRLGEFSEFIERIVYVDGEDMWMIQRLETLANRIKTALAVQNWDSWAEETTNELTSLHDNIIGYLREKNAPPAEIERASQFILGENGLIKDIQEGVQVAVRSTGVLEDLKYAAFPGQYSTFLNIRGTKNIRISTMRDWSSNYTDRVIDYRDQEILRSLGREDAFKELWPEFSEKLRTDPDTRLNQLARLFEDLRKNEKSPLEPGASSLNFLHWLEKQPSTWKNRDRVLNVLKGQRNYFINPDSVKIAVVLHVLSKGIDADRHPMERTTAANVFAVDTTTGFTGWIFGTDENGRPTRRSRVLYVNSNYGLGESLVQGAATGDIDVYLAFDDEKGNRRYVLIGQQLGLKAVWTATKEAADEALQLAKSQMESASGEEKTELQNLVTGIEQAMKKAIEQKQKTMDVPTPTAARNKFTLTNEEKLELVKAADRSSDIYTLRLFLEKLSKNERRDLAAAVKASKLSDETKKYFRLFIDNPMKAIPSKDNPLGEFWFWIYNKAPKKVQAHYLPKLPLVIKDMETSLPSRLGKRSPIMIQSRDFAKETDQDNPRIHKDVRTVLDLEKMKSDGFDLKVQPNGFLEASHPQGRKVVALIGDPSTSAIATSMAATGLIRNLKHGKDDPLPENQIVRTDKGEKFLFMVADETAPEHLRAMQNSLGVVARRGTKTSHAAIESLGMRIATVVGTENFISKLKSTNPDRAEWVELLLGTDDIQITVDGNNGFVYLTATPIGVLYREIESLRKNGKTKEADRIEQLMEIFKDDLDPAALPTTQLDIQVNLDRLPTLRRAVGWIMSNASEAWRTTKIGLSKIHYSVALLRAEFSFGYVGIHPRAIVAHEVMTLLNNEHATGQNALSSAEKERLSFLKNQWSVGGQLFWPNLLKDVEILRRNPEIVRQIDQRIQGFIPTGWNRPSAIAFFKQTHGGNVGSLAAAFPWHKKKVYRFIDFKLREMKELVGGKIFFEGVTETDSMNGFRGTTYLLSPENNSTFVLELEVLAELSKQGIAVDPMFAFVRSPEQLERCLKIADEVFKREGAKPRSIGMMVEIPINVLEADVFAKILNAYAEKEDIDWFFSFGTNDLSQGLFQFGRDVPALHGVSIGNEVSDYTANSPFVEKKPDGTYALRAYDEGRVEVYRAIVHAARTARKYARGSVSLCGEALNKLSSQSPDKAAAVAAELDAGGASVPRFLDVVKVFAAAELLNGKVAETKKNVKLASKNKLTTAVEVSEKKGAASRTLLVPEQPGDLLDIYPGDFVLLSPHAVDDLLDMPNESRNKLILSRLEYTGAFIALKKDFTALKPFLDKLKKPYLLLDSTEQISPEAGKIVSIDFSNGNIFKGDLEIVDQDPSESDQIQDLIDTNQKASEKGLPTITFNVGDFIKRKGVHPQGLSKESNRALEKLQDDLFKEFSAVASQAAAQGKTALFEMDSLRVSDYKALRSGAEYETEETNPALGVKGIFRYLINTGYDREWFLRAQIRAAIRVHALTKNVGFVVTGANVPELSAEAERIFSSIYSQMGYPDKPMMGIKISAPAQVLNLKEHINAGKYSFVVIDEKELPLNAQLADARNELLLQEQHTPAKLVRRLMSEIRHIVLVTLADINDGKAKQDQVALATNGDELPSGGEHDFSNAGAWTVGMAGKIRSFVMGTLVQLPVAAMTALGLKDHAGAAVLAITLLGGLTTLGSFRAIYNAYGNSTVATHVGFGAAAYKKGVALVQNKAQLGEDPGRLIRIPLGFTTLWIWGNSRFWHSQSVVADATVLAHELSPWHAFGLLTMAFLPLTLTTAFIQWFRNSRKNDEEAQTNPQKVAEALVSLAVATQEGRENVAVYLRAILPGSRELSRQISSLEGPKGLTYYFTPSIDQNALIAAVRAEILARQKQRTLTPSHLKSVLMELRKMGLNVESSADFIATQSPEKQIVLIVGGETDDAVVRNTVKEALRRPMTLLVNSADVSHFQKLVAEVLGENANRVAIRPRNGELIVNENVILRRLKENLPAGPEYAPSNLVLMVSSGLQIDTDGMKERDLNQLVIFFLDYLIGGIAIRAFELHQIDKIARAASTAA